MTDYPGAVTTRLKTAVNNLTFSLTAAVSIGDAIIYTSSTTGAPTASSFHIENEVIYYTGKASDRFTGCTKGQDGTVDAGHEMVAGGNEVVFGPEAHHVNSLNEEMVAVQTELGKDLDNVVRIDGTNGLSSDWDAGSHKITAEQLESDIATGTAPLVVASTTTVTNLDADTVDGADLIDEDDMASDSDTDVPTQQSVKAYVDSLTGGWITAGTFTYASGTTITVAAGAAAIYQVGDKIKFTQVTGGTKYAYITIVADTLLTINLGGLYTLENEAITAPNYSHQNSPLGFPVKMTPGYVKARVYRSADILNYRAATWESIPLDTESFDTGGDYTITARAYTNDPGIGASEALNMADTSGFTVNDAVNVVSSAGHETAIVESIVENTSITVDNLTLNHTTTDRMVTVSKFTAPVTGYYNIKGRAPVVEASGSQYKYYIGIYVDPLFAGAPAIKSMDAVSETTAAQPVTLSISDLIFLDKTDTVYLYIQFPGVTIDLDSSEEMTYISIELVSVI